MHELTTWSTLNQHTRTSRQRRHFSNMADVRKTPYIYKPVHYNTRTSWQRGRRLTSTLLHYLTTSRFSNITARIFQHGRRQSHSRRRSSHDQDTGRRTANRGHASAYQRTITPRRRQHGRRTNHNFVTPTTVTWHTTTTHPSHPHLDHGRHTAPDVYPTTTIFEFSAKRGGVTSLPGENSHNPYSLWSCRCIVRSLLPLTLLLLLLLLPVR